MKVLFVSDADAYYGAPRAMLEMVNALKDNYEIEPIVLTSEHSVINEYCEKNKIENYVTYHRSFLIDDGKISFIYLFKSMLRFFRYKAHAVVSMHLAKKYLNFDEIDMIHSNSDRNDLGVDLARRYQIKNVMHMREVGRCRSFRKNYINYLNQNVDCFLAISECVRREWKQKGIREDKVDLVYDGIDLTDIHEKEEFESDTFRIVCVGFLCIQIKHQEDIIEALEYIPNDILEKVQVDFIGDGEDERYLKSIAGKSKCKNINFLGYRNDVRELLKDYDCGIMSSSGEAFGRTTIEYGASGLAVLATKSGANFELVDDGVNGLMYDLGNPKELASKMVTLYKDESLRKKLAENAMKKARECYSKEINAKNVYHIYKRLIGQ